MKHLKLILITLSLMLIPFGQAQADQTNCQPQYGGGYTVQNCGQPALILNKLVYNPKVNTFVDNMGVNDYKFVPGEQVTFQVNITNPGTAPIAEATVTDTLPKEVDYVSSTGSFDGGKQTVTFKVQNLASGETRTLIITAKAKAMTVEQGMICSTNQVSAWANNLNAADNAQFCMQVVVVPTQPGQSFTVVQPGATTKGGLKVFPPVTAMKKTPSTGPESLALFGLIPSILTGLALRKKANTI